jgi:hypothetical protein
MRYIYITTNKVNGKKYLGQRKIPKGKTHENDSYLGSGTLLLKAIKKYGKDNFSKEVIHLCTTQKEADYLEIKEINDREVLSNKHIWYNRDAGGQYNRHESHSEITSKVMKAFYSTEQGKKIIEENAERNRKKRIDRIVSKYGSLHQYELFKYSIKAKKKLKYTNIKHKRLLLKCYNTTLNINNTVIANKKLWSENKPEKLKQIREGQNKRKELLSSLGQDYHTKEQRKKFALAKCRSSNNSLGHYIISNYDMKYNLIERKVKKTYLKVYKNKDNLIKQLQSIREIIFNETNKDIDLNTMIELTHDSLRNRGIL